MSKQDGADQPKRPRNGGPLRRLRIPLIGVVIVFTYGAGGYMLFGFSFVDALYMAALALTTAGFTPVGDLDPSEKAFTISIAILGVTMFLILLAVITSAIADGQIGTRARRRRMERRAANLRDHFIVCAYGRVGRAAAREFEADGVPYVVVDSQEELEDVMRSDSVVYMIGDPVDEQILHRAGLEHARGLLCAMDDDAANVFITVVARSLNPDIFIVARASAPQTPDVLRRAGADRVVSPYVESGSHMGRLALRPRVRDYIEVGEDEEARLRLEEILVDPASELAGRALKDVCGEAVPLLLRRRNGEAVANPSPETTLSMGDLLLVFGEPMQLRDIESA